MAPSNSYYSILLQELAAFQVSFYIGLTVVTWSVHEIVSMYNEHSSVYHRYVPYMTRLCALHLYVIILYILCIIKH